MKNILYKYTVLMLVLLTGSCTKEPAADVPSPGEKEVETKQVHYRASVSGVSGTKAGVSSATKYIFEAGDRLFVESGEDMYGSLSIVLGIGSTTAVFEGSLTCVGDFEPEDATVVTATLVSVNDRIHTITEGKVSATSYPDEYASGFSDAVSKFGDFTSTSTYGARSFTLSQQSTFLVFSVEFDGIHTDGTAISEGEEVDMILENGGTALRSAGVEPSISDGLATANFVAAFAGGDVTLSDATLSVSDGIKFSIGDQTLAANTYYNVTRSSTPYVLLPVNTDYVSGTSDAPNQAFPVQVHTAVNVLEYNLPSVFTLTVSTPSESTASYPFSLSGELTSLDAEEVRDAILSAEGKTYPDSLSYGNYVYSVNGSNQNNVQMYLYKSAYTCPSEKFLKSIDPLSEGDYVEAKMKINFNVAKQHLLGVGKNIGSWYNSNSVLFYCPCEKIENKNLRMHMRYGNSDKISVVNEPQEDGDCLVLLLDWNGIYKNGADFTGGNFESGKDYYREYILQNSNLTIGSLEGKVRSQAYYDYIRVVRY